MSDPPLKPDGLHAASPTSAGESRTDDGKTFQSRREAILRARLPLLNWDEIERELEDRGGEAREA
jgi:hypothetical protein